MAIQAGDANDYYNVGPHRVCVEPPDILHVHFGGDVEAEHFRAFNEIMDVRIPPPTGPYVLRNAKAGGFITPGARVFISKQKSFTRVRAVLTYGSSSQNRTVLSMMNRAIRVINPDQHTPSALFVDTYEEAIAWIHAHRAANQSP